MTLVEAFRAAYGTLPAAEASAPGRVNLIGEHTDYNGGAVLPAALNRRTQIAFSPTATPTWSIKSTRFTDGVERAVGAPKRDDWTDYATGALCKAVDLGWIADGGQLYIESDVPDGAGVSSSAALVTAILRAAAQVGAIKVDAVELAMHARAVENDYIGVPCGIMDQMAVGLSDFGEALALDTRDVNYEVIQIPADWGISVIHSGVRRELADGRYHARFDECQSATDLLGADHLCHLSQDQVGAIVDLPDTLRKRVQHVRSEHARTVEATAALRRGDRATFAQLMNESHRSYSQDFEASTPVIDIFVEDALSQGAEGARLTGGGFGGCIVILAAKSEVDAVVEKLLQRHPNAWLV